MTTLAPREAKCSAQTAPKPLDYQHEAINIYIQVWHLLTPGSTRYYGKLALKCLERSHLVFWSLGLKTYLSFMYSVLYMEPCTRCTIAVGLTNALSLDWN